MTTFFEHQRSDYKKSYMKSLISLAASDGFMDEGERALLLKIGKGRGLKTWQLESLLSDNYSEFEVFLPESPANKMNLLYDIMQIIYADGLVNENEILFIKRIVARLNFRPELVDHLIDLFQFGTPSPAEWRDFADHIIETFVQEPA